MKFYKLVLLTHDLNQFHKRFIPFFNFYLGVNYGRAMESGATDHTGWNKKRIKQYVLDSLVFDIDVNF